MPGPVRNARPTFTIVLCTRNRSRLLARALESLLPVDFPVDDFELCAVDNNSTDDTRRVIETFAARAPFVVRYIFESRPGLSVARNRGVQEARGEFLFFTDDDQLVHPAALREHHRAAQAYRSRVVQGAIALTFTASRPAWLHGPVEAWLGRTPDAVAGTPIAKLFGGNMVFRRDLFEEISSFREDLGKGAAGYSEDSEISARLAARGETMVFAPAAIVYHIIEPDRATARFLRRAGFDKGYSAGIVDAPDSRPGAVALSALRALRRAASAVLSASQPHLSMENQVLTAYYAGHVAGCLSGRRTAPAAPGGRPR